MINGEGNLRRQYPDLDEKQYQPAGIDLTLGKVSEFQYNQGTTYGLLKNAKVLPNLVEMETKSMQVSGMLVDVFVLQPHKTYIGTTAEFIDIDNGSGHLSFLLVNYTDELFVLEKGVRFSQLVDMNVVAPLNEYDGDYNE